MYGGSSSVSHVRGVVWKRLASPVQGEVRRPVRSVWGMGCDPSLSVSTRPQPLGETLLTKTDVTVFQCYQGTRQNQHRHCSEGSRGALNASPDGIVACCIWGAAGMTSAFPL